MPNVIKFLFVAAGGALCGYFINYLLHETIALAVLVLFSVLWVVIFLLFKAEIKQAESIETAQDALVEKLNTSIGANAAALKQSLKQATDHLSFVSGEYNDRAQKYHTRHSAFVALVKYHIYAAAIRSLHQTHNAEKACKFVRKEMEVIEKIEAGEDVFALCGDRAHQEEQALNTLLGRVNNGDLTARKAFFRCKSCGGELEACGFCGGELERRFKN